MIKRWNQGALPGIPAASKAEELIMEPPGGSLTTVAMFAARLGFVAFATFGGLMAF
jgi:hypothetical protein